jgi:hypothetical protein
MRLFLILILVLGSCFSGFGFEVKNTDKPLKGQWDFKMLHRWTVKEAGKEFFTVIDDFECSDDGIIYVMDRKLFKIFLFDKNGKFLSAIGKRGEGPGNFTNLRSLYLIGKYLVIVDDRNIHYFSPGGEYIKSILNNHVNVSPVSFINPGKFISVSIFAGADNNNDKGIVAINDLKRKEQIKLFEFPKWKKGSITVKRVEGNLTHTNTYSYSVSNLTPGMILHQKRDKLYFGINNEYKIKVSGLDGKEIFHFTLERERKKASSQYKDRIVKRFNFPDNIKKQVRKRLPDYLNYFERIYVDEKGLIYVFTTGEEKANIKKIDIFSNKGKYLYTSKVKVEEDYSIKNIYIKNSSMYINKLDSDDVVISKYKIVLPGSILPARIRCR